MPSRDDVARWREQAIHDGAMSVPQADKIEAMADMLECGLLTLYREQAVIMASMEDAYDELSDEADAVREMCERTLVAAGVTDLPSSLPGLVRAVCELGGDDD